VNLAVPLVLRTVLRIEVFVLPVAAEGIVNGLTGSLPGRREGARGAWL
jgi:hypothetical protein